MLSSDRLIGKMALILGLDWCKIDRLKDYTLNIHDVTCEYEWDFWAMNFKVKEHLKLLLL